MQPPRSHLASPILLAEIKIIPVHSVARGPTHLGQEGVWRSSLKKHNSRIWNTVLGRERTMRNQNVIMTYPSLEPMSRPLSWRRSPGGCLVPPSVFKGEITFYFLTTDNVFVFVWIFLWINVDFNHINKKCMKGKKSLTLTKLSL